MFLLVLFRKWATILVHATADYPCMEIGFPWLNQLPEFGRAKSQHGVEVAQFVGRHGK